MALRGYDRDEYEDLDEYEDDGEEQEEEYGEKEYEEEEAPQPTQDELEYLELRQRLKEAYRKQMKKESGSARSNPRDRTSKLPFDNYGSFFGPSQPVIAQRVIQESKSLLENPHLAARVSKTHHSNNNKSSTMTSAAPKAQGGSQPPKVTNGLKTKVQMIKNTRDYSFLLSDDAKVPAPAKDPPPRNVPIRNSEARPAQVLARSKPSLGNASGRVPNGHEERKPAPTARKMPPNMTSQKLPPRSKQKVPMDSRKQMGQQMGSGHGSGPGRPMVPKTLPPRTPVTMERKVSAPVAKSSMHISKPHPTRLQPSISKKPMQQKKEKDLSNGRIIAKPSVPSSKPQINQPTAKVSAHTSVKENRPKKRPVRQYPDEDEEDGAAIDMIRQMFGYNPNKYRDYDDDSDMEANFDEILMEEKRSSRIARKEDEEELRKIEEEERRIRMRKEEKKRRLV